MMKNKLLEEEHCIKLLHDCNEQVCTLCVHACVCACVHARVCIEFVCVSVCIICVHVCVCVCTGMTCCVIRCSLVMSTFHVAGG